MRAFGKGQMFDNSTDSIPAPLSEPELATPQFDETARARARPVQPLVNSQTSTWIQRARSLTQALNARTRALALVVIAGLSVGALGGTLLVKQSAPIGNEFSVADPSDGATAGEAPDVSDETHLISAEAGVSGSDQTRRRGSRRQHRPAQQPRRAYRVAVIK